MKHRVWMAIAAVALGTTLTISPTGAVLAKEVKPAAVATSEKKGPTEEEKKQAKEKMDKAIAKWNSLSKEEKNQIYALYDQERELMMKIIDKYVSLGVLDQADATQFKAHMEEQAKKMKESGSLPLPKPKQARENKSCK